MTTIQFFGRLQDHYGRELRIELPREGFTIGRLRMFLSDRVPTAGDAVLARSVKACVDGAIVGDDALLEEGQDIAFMPPVSGG